MRMHQFIILCLLSTFCLSCKSQYDVLKSRYDESVRSLDVELLEIYTATENFTISQQNGPAVYSKSIIDRFTDTNNYSHLEYDASELVDQDIKMAYGILEDETLSILIGDVFGNQFIEHIVRNGQVETRFREKYKSDDVVKLKLEDPFDNELVIPFEHVDIRLSKKKSFAKGDLIYGCGKFKTEPYYLINIGYGKDEEQIARTCEYCFKLFVK